ncbi:Tigger transposable element-derived protein 4, partial [Pseudolycoriella hygida]
MKARNANIPLTGAIVQAKARSLAKLFNIQNFMASDGWLAKFKRRQNLTFKTMSSKSASVDDEAVDDWFKQLPNILMDYDANDIFNVDETGLFFKCLPKHTLTYRNEKCYDGKFSKVRVSVLVGANCTGTEKLKLLVIGKSRRPRCFVKNESLPVVYTSNTKAWMTCVAFAKYMTDLDKELMASEEPCSSIKINKAGFPSAKHDIKNAADGRRNLSSEHEEINDDQETESHSDTINIENWNRIKTRFDLDISFDDYVAVDVRLLTEGLPSNEEILNFLSNINNVEETDATVDDEVGDNEVGAPDIDPANDTEISAVPNDAKESLRKIHNALTNNMFTHMETHMLTV